MNTADRTSKKLRPHQIEAVKAAGVHYRTNDRGQIVSPCASGKTLMGLAIKEQLSARSTLVLAPSLILLKQLKDEWVSQGHTADRIMCVCSDEGIVRDEDHVQITPSELGAPVSTDPVVVRRFLRQRGSKTIFSTYQSLPSVCAATNSPSFAFDLSVCDEAHRTAGSRSKSFGLIHDDSSIRVRKRLYMTATPRVSRPLADGETTPSSDYMFDMSDPSVFGREFFRMTFRAAIELGILADYQIVAIGVADEEVREWINDGAVIGPGEDVAEVAKNYALDLAMTKYGSKHAISFHSLVNSAMEFAKRHYRMFPGVLSTHVNGAQRADDRRLCLDSFSTAPRAAVSNARCLVEGFDLPAVDLVFFSDPKRSTVDIVQAVGRVLRVDGNRPDKVGLIAIPVFHKREEAIDSVLARSSFRHLVNIVRAMSDEDERLDAEMVRDACGYGTGNEIPSAAHSQNKDARRLVTLAGFEDQIRRSLFQQVVGRTVSWWSIRYAHLLEFRKLHHGRWPTKTTRYPPPHNLGEWCAEQRARFRRKLLPAARVRMLEDIKFPWEIEAPWLTRYQHLMAFRTENPNRWPYRDEVLPNGDNLGHWCFRQQTEAKAGRLSEEHVRLLKQCGILDAELGAWAKQYGYLQAYMAAHSGDWPTKHTVYPSGNYLGRWCVKQRSEYARGKLRQNRVALLNAMGFLWNANTRGKGAWHMFYRGLVEYRQTNPDSWPSTAGTSPQERTLAKWCIFEMRKFRKGMLPEDKVKLLQDVGFPDSGFPGEQSDKRILPDKWMAAYEGIRHYREADPTRWPTETDVHPEGKRLSKWCEKQRRDYRKGSLSVERIGLFDKLEFPWVCRSPTPWEEWHRRLVQYHSEHAGKWPLVGTQWPNGVKLGLWCSEQRKLFRKGMLRPERAKMLHQLGYPLGTQAAPSPLRQPSRKASTSKRDTPECHEGEQTI